AEVRVTGLGRPRGGVPVWGGDRVEELRVDLLDPEEPPPPPAATATPTPAAATPPTMARVRAPCDAACPALPACVPSVALAVDPALPIVTPSMLKPATDAGAPAAWAAAACSTLPPASRARLTKTDAVRWLSA